MLRESNTFFHIPGSALNTIQYLDLLQQKLGVKSDYSLALALGLSRGAISNFRVGRSCFSSDVAIKVAHLLDLPPALLMADAFAERAKDETEKAVWQEISRRFTPAGFVPIAHDKAKLSA